MTIYTVVEKDQTIYLLNGKPVIAFDLESGFRWLEHLEEKTGRRLCLRALQPVGQHFGHPKHYTADIYLGTQEVGMALVDLMREEESE